MSTATLVLGTNLSRSTGDVLALARVGADPRIGILKVACFCAAGVASQIACDGTVAYRFAGSQFASGFNIHVVVLEFQQRRIKKCRHSKRIMRVGMNSKPLLPIVRDSVAGNLRCRLADGILAGFELL